MDDSGEVMTTETMAARYVGGHAIDVAPVAQPEPRTRASQFPARIGELGVDAVLKAVNGESVEANVDTGTAIVSKENVAEFK